MITPEIISVLIGSACGVGGYLFREYQNRTRPYVHIIDVDGGLVRRTDSRPDTPNEVRTKIDGAYWIKALGTTPNVGAIHDAWDRAGNFIQLWPAERQKLDDILNSKDQTALEKSLPELFSTHFLDRIMQALISGDRINFPAIPSGVENNIPIFPGKGNNEGMVWLAFPQNTVSFGTIMHEDVMKAKAEPFLRIISSLDPNLIHPVIQQFREVCEKDFHISTEVEPKLREIRDQSSRWVLTVYFANLSNKPIMLHTKCKLSVLDHPKRRFTEDAYVVVISKSKDGDSSYKDAAYPLVIKGGEDITFAVIAVKQQKEMELGSALREAFDRGQGTCRVHLHMTRVGLFSKQKVCAHPAPFRKRLTNHLSGRG
jgi:hypothetical protein